MWVKLHLCVDWEAEGVTASGPWEMGSACAASWGGERLEMECPAESCSAWCTEMISERK